MKSFMTICLYLLLDHHGSEGITTHSVTGCSSRVNLSCFYPEKIHVERITYYNTTDCNQTLTDQQVCGQPSTGSDIGLVPSCNGRISCDEILYYTCPGSRTARVDYRCVEGDKVKGICDESAIENTNRIFLSTPNYPSPPTFTNISPCRCSIRGSNITSIDILEHTVQTSDDGTKSSLEINYGDVTYRRGSLNGTARRVYNKRLTSTSTTSEIILSHNNINKQYLWVEIQGVSMRVSCNNGTKLRTSSSTLSPSSTASILSPFLTTSSSTTTSSLPMTLQSASDESNTTAEPSFTSPAPTPTPDSSSKTVPLPNIPEEPPFKSPASTPTPTTASLSKITHPPQTNENISRRSQDNDQTIIVLAVMLSLLLLVICLTVVVFMLYRKGKLVWVKKSPEVGERNPYSGLDLTQRVAGSDGHYQVLNARNSTPQYNNVSQPFHPEYQNVN